MSGRVVIVVGGSSGIGLASAQRFAADGDQLILAARSEKALHQAAVQVQAAGAKEVHTVTLDVRDSAAVNRLIDTVVGDCGRVDVLVQAATTMAYGRLEDLPSAVFDGVVDTAIHGTANLARALLPVFRSQRHGIFVIVNSLLGAVTVPEMGAYASAKWGQRAIARTLQQELRDESGVHVILVSPGSTNTPIYYQAANWTGHAARPPVPVLQPSRVAAVIFRLAQRPRRHVWAAVGPTSPLIVAGYRMLPLLYDAIVGPTFRFAALTRRALPPTTGNVLEPQPANERVHGRWPDRND